MMDAITCPDCGVNADTCRCDLRFPHTSAMVREACPPPVRGVAQLLAGLEWSATVAPAQYRLFTTDAAGRLTLRTP